MDNAADDPTQLDEALDAIDKNLDEIGDKTDNADVNKAVDDLNKAVDNVRTSIKNGDDDPGHQRRHRRGGRTDARSARPGAVGPSGRILGA